jgi:hypothetical protein
VTPMLGVSSAKINSQSTAFGDHFCYAPSEALVEEIRPFTPRSSDYFQSKLDVSALIAKYPACAGGEPLQQAPRSQVVNVSNRLKRCGVIVESLWNSTWVAGIGVVILATTPSRVKSQSGQYWSAMNFRPTCLVSIGGPIVCERL